MSTAQDSSFSDRLGTRVFTGAMALLQRLPYARRIAVAGRLVSLAAGPLGWRRRIRENLALTCPDLTPAEVERLTRAVPDNIGRSLAEIYAGADFTTRVADLPIEGEGAAVLQAAHEAGRPIVLAAAHFGNYDAWRAALKARGYRIGAIYRPMNNRAFNAQYVAQISTIAEPLFPRNRKGLGQMLRFLREGGMVAFGFDQHLYRAPRLRFFGQPANTPTSAAEMALKLGAELVPINAIRQPNGLDFRIFAEAPIPHSDAETMTQALNDRLETLVRAHMDQWFWVHRRWKAVTHTPAATPPDDENPEA